LGLKRDERWVVAKVSEPCTPVGVPRHEILAKLVLKSEKATARISVRVEQTIPFLKARFGLLSAEKRERSLAIVRIASPIEGPRHQVVGTRLKPPLHLRRDLKEVDSPADIAAKPISKNATRQQGVLLHRVDRGIRSPPGRMYTVSKDRNAIEALQVGNSP